MKGQAVIENAEKLAAKKFLKRSVLIQGPAVSLQVKQKHEFCESLQDAAAFDHEFAGELQHIAEMVCEMAFWTMICRLVEFEFWKTKTTGSSD